jgi:hypothetical protein
MGLFMHSTSWFIKRIPLRPLVSSCTVSQVSNYPNISYQRQDRLVTCETGTMHMMAMLIILHVMQREAWLNEINT